MYINLKNQMLGELIINNNNNNKNLSCGALLFKISENFLEFKPFKTSRKLPYFEENQLCACLIYACT